jgi:hypothetical protein
MVNGKEAPFRTNCELLLESDDTVTLAPVALMVMASVPVAPTLTSPKFTDAGVMLNCPFVVVVVPVPLNGTLALVPFEALLVNDSDPETVPLPVGLNATLNDELFPAAMVNGRETPCRTNRELLLESADTVTFAPLALMVMGLLPVAPTLTLPKFTAPGVILNRPAAVVFVPVPVPVRGTSRFSLRTKRLPALVRDDGGTKVTVTVVLCPACKVMGNAGPLTENPPLVVAFRPEICTL